MDSHRVVDLYALRCAVAALVHARHGPDNLTDSQITRLDAAVGYLAGIAGRLNGELAIHTSALLAVDADPAGERTVRAIDRLAELTHVEVDAAPALAASIRPAQHPVQGSLFDDDPPVAKAAG